MTKPRLHRLHLVEHLVPRCYWCRREATEPKDGPARTCCGDLDCVAMDVAYRKRLLKAANDEPPKDAA